MPIMKNRKDNLLDSTGADWFRRRVVGAAFLHQDRVLQIEGMADADRLQVRDLTNGAKRDYVSKKIITGFGVFAYPQLGYRKVYGGKLAAHFTKKHSYERGLRSAHLLYELTPASSLVYNMQRGELNQERNENLIQALKPDYDKVDVLEALLAGDRVSAVLSHDVCVEPSVADDDEDYVVMYRQRAAARLNHKKEFRWYTPAYRRAVQPLLGNFGVHK